MAASLKSSAIAEVQSRKEGRADALAEEREDDHLIQIIVPHTLQTHLLKEADFVQEGKVTFPYRSLSFCLSLSLFVSVPPLPTSPPHSHRRPVA